MSNADVVVLVPGIMGTSLLDKDGKELWGVGAGAIWRAASSLGRSVTSLRLPDQVGDDDPQDGVTPGRVLGDIHLIPQIWTISIGYDRLITHLVRRHGLTPACIKEPPGAANLLVFGYDWRLSNRLNARRLKQVVEPFLLRWRERSGNEGARIVFVCHSMGGLIARWYADVDGGAGLVRKIITIGTPHRGSAKALQQLSRPIVDWLGPVSERLLRLAQSLPSLYQLLPEYAFIDKGGTLLKASELVVPELASNRVRDAATFHSQLNSSARTDPQFDLYPIVGINQPTVTTVVANESVPWSALRTIEGADEGGDGTVPRLAARPVGLRGDSPVLSYVGETHGALQGNRAVLDQIDGILTGSPVERRLSSVRIGVSVSEWLPAGAEFEVAAEASDASRVLAVQVVDSAGRSIGAPHMMKHLGGGNFAARLHGLSPGEYLLRTGWRRPDGLLADVVTAAVAVFEH
ncbi:lipase/acyltransferase domain-containing protein [Allorhizocola rhizosphaerae]|uniref:lipase/acyltransferase domain-containing protein n=1 Tax=Allorhizocola rhizosphaerae TaxID=1872709 RepID=UPI000E3C24B4|nr:hypothetical protein [Allorhizocola rhizosphaerae]